MTARRGRKAEAFSVVGMTSPVRAGEPGCGSHLLTIAHTAEFAGLLGLRTATTTARSPHRDGSEQLGTASLACGILPSRSETNTGRGALAMIRSARRTVRPH
jgi:hypothetical protein